MGYKDNPVETIYGEPKPTYMVVRIDGQGQAPKHKHPSRTKAHGESIRLAKKHPGVPFAVVKVKSIHVGSEANNNETLPTGSDATDTKLHDLVAAL